MANVRRRAPHEKLVYRSIRVEPNVFVQVEAFAAQEHISVNALCNAIFALQMEQAQTDEGRTQLHAACTNWRTRWEHVIPEGRQARLEERDA